MNRGGPSLTYQTRSFGFSILRCLRLADIPTFPTLNEPRWATFQDKVLRKANMFFVVITGLKVEAGTRTPKYGLD
jgi:hypothetical protein